MGSPVTELDRAACGGAGRVRRAECGSAVYDLLKVQAPEHFEPLLFAG